MRTLWTSLKMIGVVAATLAASTPPAVARALGVPPARAARLGARCATWWGRRLRSLIGIEVRATSLPHGAPFAVTSNHLSYLDIIVLASLYPSVFVAKSEIARWPIFGRITRSSGTLFVDRDRPRDVVRAGREMERCLESGIPLTLFPEGRTTNGRSVLPFLPSLLDPMARRGVPCFAVTLRYAAPGAGMPVSRAVCWADGQNLVHHFWALLQLPRVEAEVRFAATPVVSTDRKELARRLHEAVSLGFSPLDDGCADAETAGAAPLAQGEDPS